MENISLSKHAIQRASQRVIDERQIKICLEFGEQFHRTGAMFFMMTKKCMKKLKHSFGAYMPRLDGIVVVGHSDSNTRLLSTIGKN